MISLSKQGRTELIPIVFQIVKNHHLWLHYIETFHLLYFSWICIACQNQVIREVKCIAIAVFPSTYICSISENMFHMQFVIKHLATNESGGEYSSNVKTFLRNVPSRMNKFRCKNKYIQIQFCAYVRTKWNNSLPWKTFVIHYHYCIN